MYSKACTPLKIPLKTSSFTGSHLMTHSSKISPSFAITLLTSSFDLGSHWVIDKKGVLFAVNRSLRWWTRSLDHKHSQNLAVNSSVLLVARGVSYTGFCRSGHNLFLRWRRHHYSSRLDNLSWRLLGSSISSFISGRDGSVGILAGTSASWLGSYSKPPASTNQPSTLEEDSTTTSTGASSPRTLATTSEGVGSLGCSGWGNTMGRKSVSPSFSSSSESSLSTSESC